MAAQRAWRGSGSLATTGVEEISRRRVTVTCLAFTFLNPHVYLDTMVLLGSLSTRYPGILRWDSLRALALQALRGFRRSASAPGCCNRHSETPTRGVYSTL